VYLDQSWSIGRCLESQLQVLVAGMAEGCQLHRLAENQCFTWLSMDLRPLLYVISLYWLLLLCTYLQFCFTYVAVLSGVINRRRHHQFIMHECSTNNKIHDRTHKMIQKEG